MRFKLIVLLLAITSFVQAQKVITRNGVIQFDATVPGATDQVLAKNNSVSAILDKATGALAVQVMIKSFRFKLPLMEEHFNENYMESDQFPKATFKGKIKDFDSKSGSYEVEGDLMLHGITQKVKTKLTVKNEAGKLYVEGMFNVKLKDYGLSVPALAKKTLAETAKLTFDFIFEQKS
jgi:hypothetical protein